MNLDYETISPRPSRSFTERVLARAREARRQRNRRRRATAAALLALVLTGSAAFTHLRTLRAERVAAEQRALRTELDQLRQLTEEATRDELIYLGSSGEIEYVVNAADLAAAAKNTHFIEQNTPTGGTYQ